ncbi:MAG: hypothetical protein ACFFBD_05275 [Candidatus Hodarchaeota archaeon]
MSLKGVFILPHGSMILDPSKEDIPVQAKNLHSAMQNAAHTIKELHPDLIFLTTPHGIALSHDFGIYMNKGASGSAEWNGEYSNFKVKIEIEQTLVSQLYDYLRKKDVAITGITSYGAMMEIPLRWGEVVPLWFLKDLPSQPKYLIMSQPTRRNKHAIKMIPELLELGNHLKSFFESLDKKVVVIVSADLAHTHSVDGPYKHSKTAEPFDQLIEHWASTLNTDPLLKKTKDLLYRALCCGYIGLVILHGMLENTNLRPEVLIRASPTYYGMMVAKFT